MESIANPIVFKTDRMIEIAAAYLRNQASSTHIYKLTEDIVIEGGKNTMIMSLTEDAGWTLNEWQKRVEQPDRTDLYHRSV